MSHVSVSSLFSRCQRRRLCCCLPSAFCCHAAAALQCCYITPSSSSAAAVARELKSYRGTGATPLVAPCCLLLTSFCSCCCCRLLSRDLRFPLMSAPPDRVSAGWVLHLDRAYTADQRPLSHSQPLPTSGSASHNLNHASPSVLSLSRFTWRQR